jgi:hypothetical protein
MMALASGSPFGLKKFLRTRRSIVAKRRTAGIAGK